MTIEILDLLTNEEFNSIPDSIINCYSITLLEPSLEELCLVGEKFNIPIDELEDALDEDERPRLEVMSEGNILKVIFRLPKKQNQIDDIEGIITHPVGIFLGEKFILQIFPKPILRQKKIRPSKLIYNNRTTFTIFYNLLEFITQSFKLRLDILDAKIHDVEKELFKTIRPESILKIFSISKESIHLSASLKGNLKVYYRLGNTKMFRNNKEFLELLSDVQVDLEQQAELMDIYRDLIENSLDAYTGVISNNQNDLIKTLTSISLILIFPTLIASLYGMNVRLPFMDSPYAFLIITIISAISTFLLYLFFRIRKWM